MIGYLEGKVLYSDGKKLILKTQAGIGYEINYGYFVQVGGEAQVYTHFHYSENDQSLWGFNSIEDKKIFELLKSVNKVGSSKAYPLITQVGSKNVLSAIRFEQAEVLTQAQGIGKKMAEQIILSLKDKVDKLEIATGQPLTFLDTSKTDAEDAQLVNPALYKEAMQALESLGYKDKDVLHLVNEKIKVNNITSTEELLKIVLREL